MSIKKTLQAIRKHDRFLISTHINPDPDALCSELALARCLRFAGKKVTIINEESVPGRLKIFPGSSSVRAYRPKMRVSFDAAIVLDCGELSRIGKVADLITKGKALINIDHHITNDKFGNFNLVKPGASSTAEVLYELIKAGRFRMTRNTALNLYAGIMTDTGSFRYENTASKTHVIASELLKYNFSVPHLYQKIYETIPLKDFQLLTKVVSRFDAVCQGRVVCVDLPRAVQKKFTKEFDLRDMVFKLLRSIKGVQVLAIFTQVGVRETRVNFRSTDHVNVAKLAHHFKGGGHRRASGCVIAKSMKQARGVVLRQIRPML